MDTDTATLVDLFGKERRYLVPLFQRGYVWQQTPEWEGLWSDIVDRTEALAAQPNSLPRKHFLGALVLQHHAPRLRQAPSSEVIDGQQRLTTLQVLLAAFRDAIPQSEDNAFLRGELQRLTGNSGQYTSPDDAFKVWPTTAYQSDFRAAMTAGSVEEIERLYPARWYRRKLVPPRPPLVDCYLYFSTCIRKFLFSQVESAGSEPEYDSASADWLYHALSSYLQLVVIELGADDDPQVIFETLNGKGVPLGPADLVRNFLFLTAARNGPSAPELYEKYWKGFDEPGVATRDKFWAYEERQGRYKRSRIDLFFFHYLRSRSAHDLKLEHLYQEFRDWWNSEPRRDLEVEMAAIWRSAQVFRSLLVPDPSDRWGKLAERLRILDTATAYPVLIWLAEHRLETEPVEFDGMLVDLESYVVRRAVCGMTSKNYNRLFLGVLDRLHGAGTPRRDVLQGELLSLQGESVVWPDDAVFRAALVERPLYRELGPSKTQMLLRALNDALHTARQEDVQLNSWLTVEHVLPQNAESQHWPYPPQPEESEPLAHWITRYRMTDTLGNLTLLTQRLNSSVGRGPFKHKRPKIAEQSLLAVNVYFQRLSDEDPWDEREIRVRGESVADLALGVWPRP
jgi:hypothetical protein